MDVKRGDVFLVNFNPARGSEQAGFRPSVVIQNDIGNKRSSIPIVAAVTTAESKERNLKAALPLLKHIRKDVYELKENCGVKTSS